MSKTLVMNNSAQCVNIFNECVKGNFEKTLEHLNSKWKGKISNSIALNILFSCSNPCFHKKDDISEELLLKILRSIQPFLKKSSEMSMTECSKYIHSMGIFVQFLIYKNSPKIILQIEDILILDFKKEELAKKQIAIYDNIVKSLYNIIIKSAKKTNGYNHENNHEILFKISSLILRLSGKFLDITTAIFLASNCFNSFLLMKLSVQYQIEYYKAFLNSLDFRQVKPRSETVFKSIQSFSFNILNNILIMPDFKKALNFINDISRELSIVLNHEEYIHLHELLRYFLIIKLNDKSSEISKGTYSFFKLIKIWGISDRRRELNQYICKLLRTTKNYYSSEEEHLKLIQFLIEINSLAASTNNKIENIHTRISYGEITLELIKNYFTRENPNLEYHQEFVDSLFTFFKDNQLKITDLEWGKAWSNLGIYIFNTGLILYNQKNTAASLYLHLILNLFVNFDDIHSTMHLNYLTLNSTFVCLTKICSKDCKIQLAYISLAVLLCNKDIDYYMSQWIHIKHGHKDNEEIQNLNLVTAMELLRDNVPKLKLNNLDKISLLKVELEYYKRKWRSKISIVCALKEFIKIADTENTVNTIVNIFIDMDIPNRQEISDILNNLIKTYEKLAISNSSKMNLALLYYIYFKSCHKIIAMKNSEELEKAELDVVPLHPDTNPLNPSDSRKECNIFSFENLNLDVCIKNFKNLELSLLSFDEVVPKLKIDDFEVARLLQSYDSLLEICFQFKLTGFTVKGIKALELALKIAQMINNVPLIIKSIGFIIEQTGLNTKNPQKLVKLADTLIEDISFNTSDNLELCILYYICKSKAVLYNDYQESFNLFRKANDLFHLTEEKDGIIKSRLFMLNSTFSKLPCNLAVGTHEKSLLMNACSAMDIIIEEYRTAKIVTPYLVLILIQASEELVKLYHHLKCPREVRGYAKEIVFLTQKLVLPIPAATFLMYLAHSDLLLGYQDDCQVNINHMASILNLNQITGHPGKTYLKQHSASSPSLQTQSFSMPSTAFHKNTCDCFYCECDMYPNLVLEKYRLSALMSAKEKNFTIAEDFFQGALTLYEYYSKRLSEKRDFVPDFLPSYVPVLLDYSRHQWITNNKCEAVNLNTKLLEYVEKEKWNILHLYNEALLHRLGYLNEDLVPEPEPELLTGMDNLQVSDTNYLLRTPENNQNKVSIIVEHSQLNSPPKLKVKKCLRFILSPEGAVSSTVSSKNYESPKNPIYPEAERKRTKKIHSIKTEKSQTPRVPKTSVSEKKTREKTKTVPKELPSDHFADSVMDKMFKARTKLLTERLKKKGEPLSEIENEPHCNLQGVSKTYPAIKKCLNDLADAEQKPVGKGAIRKSTRAKK